MNNFLLMCFPSPTSEIIFQQTIIYDDVSFPTKKNEQERASALYRPIQTLLHDYCTGCLEQEYTRGRTRSLGLSRSCIK